MSTELKRRWARKESLASKLWETEYAKLPLGHRTAILMIIELEECLESAPATLISWPEA